MSGGVDMYDLERYRAALDFESWVLEVRGMRWAELRSKKSGELLLAKDWEAIQALLFLYEAAKVVPGMIRELRELREKVGVDQ